jgi:hypothetical protein
MESLKISRNSRDSIKLACGKGARDVHRGRGSIVSQVGKSKEKRLG